jgi:hypothetical protein
METVQSMCARPLAQKELVSEKIPPVHSRPAGFIRMSDKNVAHILFDKHLKELGLRFEREYRFHPLRKWKLDYYLHGTDAVDFDKGEYIGIEIQGGFYRGKGGHNSINGMQRDMDKGNAATMLGIRLLHFSTADVLRGRAKAFLAQQLCIK